MVVIDTIIVPCPITVRFIREHDYSFIYSSDVRENGFFGQMNICKGEPNCFPVYVMWKTCRSSGFFSDSQFKEICELNATALKKLPPDKLVIPFPKIGRGYSRMFEFAPNSYNWLMYEIAKLSYPQIKYSYG